MLLPPFDSRAFVFSQAAEKASSSKLSPLSLALRLPPITARRIWSCTAGSFASLASAIVGPFIGKGPTVAPVFGLKYWTGSLVAEHVEPADEVLLGGVAGGVMVGAGTEGRDRLWPSELPVAAEVSDWVVDGAGAGAFSDDGPPALWEAEIAFPGVGHPGAFLTGRAEGSAFVSVD